MAIVTLTTDFGLSDHYVGTMKGVVLSRCPDAVVVDISHEVPAFSIYAGAYTIDQAARYFPPGTVHVVVIDPGVGTDRKAVVVEAARQVFVAPDNGVLTMVLNRSEHSTVHEITNSELFVHPVSNTFHGRDVFAPVGAALAAGRTLPADVGPALQELLVLPDVEPEQSDDRTWKGIVLSVDHFGNVITNFSASDLEDKNFELRIAEATIDQFFRSFGRAPEAELFAYAGSSGFIELGIKQGSAAEALSVGPEFPVELSLFP